MKKSMLGRSGAAAVVLSILAAVTLGGCASAEDVPTGPNGEDEAEADSPDVGQSNEALPEQTGSTSEALSGPTCRESATDDYDACRRLQFTNCYSGFSDSYYVYCMDLAATRCKPKYVQAKTLCDLDVATIYRVNQSGFHNETKVFYGGTVEAQFNFFPRRYTGADPNPIYRCPVNRGFRDFPSRDPNCEGNGAPISVLGYSLPRGVRGAKAVYRCRDSDHFLSWQANCEGKINEELIGYAW